MAYNDNDVEEFDKGESKAITFDFRGFLFKVLLLWKLIILCIGAALLIAYFINVRKENIYQLDSLISIDSEQSPFFTANTSISFNWGGVSGKVGRVITTFKTRSHNEKVVDSLQFYMYYMVQGKYRLNDVYKNAPFYIDIDKSKGQIIGKPIRIRFINDTQYEIFTEFERDRATVQHYDATKNKQQVSVPLGSFKQIFSIDEPVRLPFLNFTLHKKTGKAISPESKFYVYFENFDAIVNHYKHVIRVAPIGGSGGVLKLTIRGNNKHKIVDYLNATTAILSRSELERKNLYASNTIKFIDSSLAAVNLNLKDIIDEMNAFRKENKIFNVSEEMTEVSSRLRKFELAKEDEQTKLNYLDALETYLQTKTDYTNIAVPTSVGINEGNILSRVGKITALAIERQNLEYTTREGSPLFKDLDRQIDAEKNVLFETIDATKNTIRLQMKTLDRSIAIFEGKLSGLPEDEQNFLKIRRKLDISQQSYDVYLAKRSEAAIVRAANVSDIRAIDEAKDIGGGKIGPNTSLNYMMALMVGFFAPMLVIFIVFLLDNTIHGSDEVVQLSKIPILGLIGKYIYKNNLVVYDKPKSAVSESFRAIRSSLQFILKNQKIEGGKTLMVTSSVSGEGKTFCCINIATVFALSGLKTILLGWICANQKSLEILT